MTKSELKGLHRCKPFRQFSATSVLLRVGDIYLCRLKADL